MKKTVGYDNIFYIVVASARGNEVAYTARGP